MERELGKKTMPLFYYSRGGKKDNHDRSDLRFVVQRMNCIPSHLKNDLSNIYDNIMLSSDKDARTLANVFLQAVAIQYRK